jgi:hypothetical protein
MGERRTKVPAGAGQREGVQMRSRTLKVAEIAALVSAFVLASGLSTAEATRTVKIASHITIKSNELTFSGRVTASNAACRNDRKVTLYRKQSQVLGSTTTNSSGSWKINASGYAGISQGRFYAKVKQRSEGTAGTVYVCKAATSKTIPFKQLEP